MKKEQDLTPEELKKLVQSVFAPRDSDRALAVLVDLPDEALPDDEHWRTRRELAHAWTKSLRDARDELAVQEVLFCPYRNVRANNADLPAQIAVLPEDAELPADADAIEERWLISLDQMLERCSILIAMTELSATAPLKVIGRQGTIRAATMPGFGPSMIPALRLDYGEINRRCDHLKRLLDDAVTARLSFKVGEEDYELELDLRFRTAHASGGIQRELGQVGNLPSGETYIVPYEGEREGEPSRSSGVMPVQFGDEIVLYRIEENRAVEVLSEGERSEAERRALAEEPAYANLAELGFGVLAAFGVEPCGEILLDEKLGLHIAFGRSDHFGGQVGPSDFSSPQAVVHIDRVYLPQTQPDLRLRLLDLETSSGSSIRLMSDGDYAVELGGSD